MYRYVGQGKQNLMILKLPILWYFCLSKTVFLCFSCQVVFCLVTPFYHVDHKMFQLDTSSRNSESGEFKGLKKNGSNNEVKPKSKLPHCRLTSNTSLTANASEEVSCQMETFFFKAASILSEGIQPIYLRHHPWIHLDDNYAHYIDFMAKKGEKKQYEENNGNMHLFHHVDELRWPGKLNVVTVHFQEVYRHRVDLLAIFIIKENVQFKMSLKLQEWSETWPWHFNNVKYYILVRIIQIIHILWNRRIIRFQ